LALISLNFKDSHNINLGDSHSLELEVTDNKNSLSLKLCEKGQGGGGEEDTVLMFGVSFGDVQEQYDFRFGEDDL
jgi:hypothetical protein